MWPNSQFPTDLVTFTEEILKRKFNFLCSVPMNTKKSFSIKYVAGYQYNIVDRQAISSREIFFDQFY